MNIGDNKEFKKMIESKGLTGNIFDANLYFQNKKITSLKGIPKVVYGYVNIRKNDIENLKYFPEKVTGFVNCSYNKITSLKGMTNKIIGFFDCSNNQLKSLEFCPKIINGSLDCRNNPDLKNIKRQVIKYQIRALNYYTDEGFFSFDEIKEEFESFITKEQIKKEKLKNHKNIDYGFSI